MIKRILTAVLMTLFLGLTAHSESLYATDVVCPIGGKKFSYLSTGTFQTWGERPDGKTYADWPDPMPLPVCPDNGLVMFTNFSPADLKKIKPLIASREYQAMRRTDTEYYLVYWLKRRLDASEVNLLWTLLQSSWQADTNPVLKKRYQQEYVDGAARLDKPMDMRSQFNWLSIQARRANALRELGQFDEAASLIDSLLSDMQQNYPEPPRDGNLQPNIDGKSNEEVETIQAGIVRANTTSYLEKMRAVVIRRDSSPEPFDMLPVRVVASRCMDEHHDDELFKSVCATDPVVKRIERMRRLNLPRYRPEH